MKTVFIVEGHKDAYQVKGALGSETVECIVTHGTKVNNRIKNEIDNHIANGNPVYILSDPDIAGDHLADMIQSWYPDVPRIDASFDECKYCKDIRRTKYKAGIEYASYKYLRKLLGVYINV